MSHRKESCSEGHMGNENLHSPSFISVHGLCGSRIKDELIVRERIKT